MTQENTSTPPPQPTPPVTPDYGRPAGGMFAPPAVPTFDADKDARLWGMLAHLLALSGLVGIPLGTVIGPLIIWLIKRQEIPFVDDQGKESLNFQITALIASIICSPLICLAGIGLLLIIAIGAAHCPLASVRPFGQMRR